MATAANTAANTATAAKAAEAVAEAVAPAAPVTGAADSAPAPEAKEGQRVAAVTAASPLTKGRRRNHKS